VSWSVVPSLAALLIWPSWRLYAAMGVLILGITALPVIFRPPVEQSVVVEMWSSWARYVLPLTALYVCTGAALVALRRFYTASATLGRSADFSECLSRPKAALRTAAPAKAGCRDLHDC
jgi:hypothetical protein